MIEETSSTYWRKVESPVPWRPEEPGESITGTYLGTVLKQAVNGEYNAHLLQETKGNVLSITGVVVDTLLKVGNVQAGNEVKVVFRGWGVSKNLYEYRDFDVYVRR